MRITNPSDLQRFKKNSADQQGESGMSSWATRQIEAALEAEERKAGQKPGVQSKKPDASKKPARKAISGESPGEASVRMALFAAFGDWFKGGEVVPELRPFKTRRFRTDYGFPRFRFLVRLMAGAIMANFWAIMRATGSGGYFSPVTTGSRSG